MKNAKYEHKRVAVLGMGESGEAAAILLAEEGAIVTALDTGEEQKLRPKIEALRRRGISCICGPAAELHDPAYDLAVLSPGIDPAVPLVRNFERKGIEMIGELELSYDLCACPIVAITGTNGKTTTTGLIAEMFNACGVKTVASGNIGPAFAAMVRRSSGLDLMTLEVSSFQLEKIRAFRPQISVWLNFAPDHLDRYQSVEEYRQAKLRIFENQKEEDFAVVNFRDELPPLKPGKITFSAFAEGADFSLREGTILHHGAPVLKMEETHLSGSHNAENLMAALGAGLAHGLGFDPMARALRAYKPLPHRCEPVRTLDGVLYINDSKATNLDALEKALLSETRPVVLIAGGKDKGFEFDTLASLVARKAHDTVLIGEMAERIASSWRPGAPCELAGSLAEAVDLARNKARAGDVVLFSPGTSSFDMFKNYADRGNQFRSLVQNLPTRDSSHQP